MQCTHTQDKKFSKYPLMRVPGLFFFWKTQKFITLLLPHLPWSKNSFNSKAAPKQDWNLGNGHFLNSNGDLNPYAKKKYIFLFCFVLFWWSCMCMHCKFQWPLGEIHLFLLVKKQTYSLTHIPFNSQATYDPFDENHWHITHILSLPVLAWLTPCLPC